MKKSKLIQNTVDRSPQLDKYYVEQCDDQAQHWVHCVDGYIFAETETITAVGFDIRTINKIIKNIVHDITQEIKENENIHCI